MTDTCEVDVYWTVQNGRRRTISLCEAEARELLNELQAYDESPQGWTVQHTRETVPTVTGQVVEGEGEIIDLDEEGEIVSRTSFKPVHIFWHCPWCGHRHNTRLSHVLQGQPRVCANPSLLFCEDGDGIVLVKW